MEMFNGEIISFSQPSWLKGGYLASLNIWGSHYSEDGPSMVIAAAKLRVKLAGTMAYSTTFKKSGAAAATKAQREAVSRAKIAEPSLVNSTGK